MPQIVLVATLSIKPDAVGKYLEALKPAYEAVIAEKELLAFEVTTVPEEPGVFKLVETWNATKDWLFTVQLKKAYYVPYAEAITPLFAKPVDLQVYECVEGFGIRK